MENKMPEPIPYIAYEGTMARFERTIKRLTICLMVVIILLVATNGAWIWFMSGYDISTDMMKTVQDGHGINVIGGGDISNVTNGSDQTQKNAEEK